MASKDPLCGNASFAVLYVSRFLWLGVDLYRRGFVVVFAELAAVAGCLRALLDRGRFIRR